jgi:hypothetical protein
MQEEIDQQHASEAARRSRYLVDLRAIPSSKHKKKTVPIIAWLRQIFFEIKRQKTAVKTQPVLALEKKSLRRPAPKLGSVLHSVAGTFALPFVSFGRLLVAVFHWFQLSPKKLTLFLQKTWRVFNFLNFASLNKLRQSGKGPKSASDPAEPQAYFEYADQLPLGFVESAEVDRPSFGRFNFRLALSFFTVLLVLILPMKGFSYFESLDDLRIKVMTSSEAAINDLFKAGSSANKMNFSGASTSFTDASKNFTSAQSNLGQINSLIFEIAKIIPNDQAKLAGNSKSIVDAGKIVSDLGLAVSSSVDGLVNDRHAGLDVALKNLVTNGQKAVVLSEQLDQVLATIDANVLPANVQPKFNDLRSRAGIFHNSLAELTEIAQKLIILTGVDHDTRYLLVFQNNSEMRASGGFFGSYALLDFSKGKIKKIEVPAGGTYDVEAGYLDRIVSPTPLHIVNPLWHLWDANWWYDWPTTANKLAYFYEKSGGPTVDGVISFTPTVIEDILRAYGPVDLTKDYGVVVTADNFWQVAQTFSEQKQDVTLKPKRIIGDLFNKMVAEMPNRLNRPMLLAIYSAFEKSLYEKQAMVYFKNSELADFARIYGWDGRAKETAGDYLAVINSSVAGGKSDREIDQTIKHHAMVLADGSVIDELEIVRTHQAIRGADFTGVRNVDWLRVYVPAGSELIEARGFNAPDAKYFQNPDPTWKTDADLDPEEKNFQLDQLSGTKIYQELGKTVFANWTMIDPGETKHLYLKYRLPFKVVKEVKPDMAEPLARLLNIKTKNYLSYGLLAQKQPGSLRVKFESSLNTEPYQRAVPSELAWSYPASLSVNTSTSGWLTEADFDQDLYFAELLSQK